MNTGKIALNLAGPELLWVLAYRMLSAIAMQNKPATEAGNDMLENMVWYLLIGSIIVSFLPLLWAGPQREWWYARIALAGVVGICAISSVLCEAIRYNDSRDSGVGTLYIIMIIFGWIVLLLGLLGAFLFFRFRAPGA